MGLANNELNKLFNHLHRVQQDLKDADDDITANRSVEAVQNLQNAFNRASYVAPKIFEILKKIERSSLKKKAVLMPEIDSKISLVNPKCSFQSDHIFQCKISLPALMKSSETGRFYSEIIGEEIQKLLAAESHKQHHRFKKICVIFVNNLTEKPSAQQPYYDNDNILIKHILDSIISYIAYDDSTYYCSNIYSYDYQADSGFTIYVVEEGHLIEWCEANRQVVFAKEILEKTAKNNR